MTAQEQYRIPDVIREYVGGELIIRAASERRSKQTLWIDGLKGRFVLKVAPGKDGRRALAREKFNLEHMKPPGLLMPKVHLYLEGVRGREPVTWLLTSWLPGKPLEDWLSNGSLLSGRYDLLYRFGQALASLHSVTVPGGDPGPGAQPPVLVHRNCTLDHVLADEEGQITGMTGWDEAGYGDPLEDLRLATRPVPCAFLHFGDFQSFFEGYGRSPDYGFEWDRS